MVLYIADDSGGISKVDLRTNATSEVIFNRRGPLRVSHFRMDDSVSTKAMVQFSNNFNHLLLGGEGFDILLMDLRVNSIEEKDTVVQKWNPKRAHSCY